MLAARSGPEGGVTIYDFERPGRWLGLVAQALRRTQPRMQAVHFLHCRQQLVGRGSGAQPRWAPARRMP